LTLRCCYRLVALHLRFGFTLLICLLPFCCCCSVVGCCCYVYTLHYVTLLFTLLFTFTLRLRYVYVVVVRCLRLFTLYVVYVCLRLYILRLICLFVCYTTHGLVWFTVAGYVCYHVVLRLRCHTFTLTHAHIVRYVCYTTFGVVYVTVWLPVVGCLHVHVWLRWVTFTVGLRSFTFTFGCWVIYVCGLRSRLRWLVTFYVAVVGYVTVTFGLVDGWFIWFTHTLLLRCLFYVTFTRLRSRLVTLRYVYGYVVWLHVCYVVVYVYWLLHVAVTFTLRWFTLHVWLRLRCVVYVYVYGCCYAFTLLLRYVYRLRCRYVYVYVYVYVVVVVAFTRLRLRCCLRLFTLPFTRLRCCYVYVYVWVVCYVCCCCLIWLRLYVVVTLLLLLLLLLRCFVVVVRCCYVVYVVCYYVVVTLRLRLLPHVCVTFAFGYVCYVLRLLVTLRCYVTFVALLRLLFYVPRFVAVTHRTRLRYVYV